MAVALNKSTQILIDNFVSTYFANIPSDNIAKIKESVVEIADSILEQSNKDIDKLTTKGDLRDEIALAKNELKNEIAVVRSGLKDEIASARSELKDEIAVVRSELKDEIAVVKSDMKNEIALVRDDILLATKNSILEAKYDLLKWLVTAQLAIAGLLLAMIKLI